jgi:ABC-type dipeptide/oligopeptide/nickel transport system permease subunit
LGTTIPFIFKRTDLIFKEISSGLILISPPIILLILGTGDFTDILTPSSVGIIYGILSGLGVCYLVVRSAVIEISNQEFINASKLLGGKNLYIATRHIMPVLYVSKYDLWNISIWFCIILWTSWVDA